MLTKLTVRNFKRFGEVEIELGSPVVFIGPNNSGKTSAMQALALWDIGLKRWQEKRSGKSTPEKRPGVTVNRRDLVAIPIPDANLLWRAMHVRDVRRVDGRQTTSNVRIDLIVEGVTNDTAWACGLEFDYANEESLYCRPLRLSEGKPPNRMRIPDEATTVQVAFLPPMSGLAATETRLDQGAVNVRIGEGRTAEVLRNLCFRIHQDDPERWQELVGQINSLFGSDLDPPRYVAERGEITMTYREGDVRLDLSSSGRGLQQTLLLLAYLYANPGAVLLLYEAAERDVVVAFVGPPHRIDDRGSQVRKALRDIGFDQYYQAEQTGWVLYLEGSTDLSFLHAFASRLGHLSAAKVLERPFVHYVGNRPTAVQDHFHGLREACPTLRGLVLFDRLDPEPPDMAPVECLMWQRREIENYVCTRATLEAYATASAPEDVNGPLFTRAEADRRLQAMRAAIDEIESALKALGKPSPWNPDSKVSDDFLTPLFKTYFEKLDLPNLMAKKNFHELVQHVPKREIDTEISEKLDAIVRVALQ